MPYLAISCEAPHAAFHLSLPELPPRFPSRTQAQTHGRVFGLLPRAQRRPVRCTFSAEAAGRLAAFVSNTGRSPRRAPLQLFVVALCVFLTAQFRLNKHVDVAIHYGFHFARLGAFALVSHHLIWLKHVRANLISPRNLAFLAVLPLYLGAFFVFFELIKLCFQHFHRQLAITPLATLSLAGDDYSTRSVQNPHRSFDLVHVLSAFAAAAKRADLEISWINFNRRSVGDFRHNIHTRE